MISGKGRRGSRRCGAAAFAAPFGRKPYGATSCRARLPRHRPQPVPAVTPRCRAHEQGQAVTLAPSAPIAVRKVTATGTGTPRIVRVGPSSVKGTRRSFLTASQKGSSGPTLERRSLCRPSGPDGEGQATGQARNARRTSTYNNASEASEGLSEFSGILPTSSRQQPKSIGSSYLGQLCQTRPKQRRSPERVTVAPTASS